MNSNAVIDPNSTFHLSREARVTSRDTTTSPFIAPDLSGVGTHALELDKGIPGWTDLDIKMPELKNSNGLSVGHAERELEALNVGTMIRRTPAKNAPKVRKPRPTTRRWS